MKKRNTELMISPGFLHKFTKSLPDCSTCLEKSKEKGDFQLQSRAVEVTITL